MLSQFLRIPMKIKILVFRLIVKHFSFISTCMRAHECACIYISIYRRFDEGVTVDKEGLEEEGKEDLRRITPTGSLQSLKKPDIPSLSRT